MQERGATPSLISRLLCSRSKTTPDLEHIFCNNSSSDKDYSGYFLYYHQNTQGYFGI